MTTANTVRAPLRIDPFFSGEGNIGQRTQQAPRGYHDVGAEPPLRDGRAPAAVMRSSPNGLRGTVIPKATPGGIPQGTRPHAVQDMQITIDPHLEGQSTTLNLRDVNPAAMREASLLADQSVPEPASIEETRLHGAVAMHQVAAIARAVPIPAPRTVSAAAPAQAVGYGQVAGGMESRPLRSFFQAAATMPSPQPTYREERAIMVDEFNAAPPQQQQGPPAPTIEVVFEIDGFGQHTAMYHHVIATEGHVILILREDWRSGRFFPKPSEHQMALMLGGQPQIYLVQTTGVRYSYAGNEFCLLLVEKVAEWSPAPVNPPQG